MGATRGVSRRRWLGAAGALAAGAAAAACSPLRPAPRTDQASQARAAATVTVWQHPLFPWRADVGKEITDPLLAANPWLTLDAVELVRGGEPAGREKVLAAAAGGVPPDTYTSGSYWDQQDFVDGLTRSLEPYLGESKVLRKADIWDSLRRDVEFRGHMTSVPYAPDTRQMFVHWETAERAGLDPNQPPERWSELEAAAQQAFRGSGGAVQHMGWAPFWGTGLVFTWLVPYWQLGGELLDAQQTRVTLANEHSLRALTWLKRIVDNQGGWEAMQAFRSSFPATDGASLFMAGATTFYYATLAERGQTFNIKAPDMRYSIAAHPLPDEGGTPATFGGCHTLPIPRGSKQPDAAWLFIEHVTNPDSNARFALRYDRVPIRESTAHAAAYLGGDRGRLVQTEAMRKRRFLIAAPGGLEMQPHLDVVTPVMSGKASLQDTLKDHERLLQDILDKYAARANNVRL